MKQILTSSPLGTITNKVTSTPISRPLSRSYERMNDGEIVAWCQKGDMGAMEALISRFKRPIYSLAYRLAGNYDDASDVAASTILCIYQNVNKCKSTVNLSAWVNRIVINTFYDICRSTKRGRVISLDVMTQDTDSSNLPCLTCKEKSPLTIAMESEQRGIIGRALARLPGLHTEILSQYYLEELSYVEISAIAHAPIGTVKSRLNRARQALLRNLQPYRMAFVY